MKQNLITGLEGLADALPETTDYLVDQGGRDALNSLRGVGGGFSGKMKMKTIKSKAGAQKRKEKVLREECERFGKNLAVINSGILSAQGASAAGDRKPASALPTPVSSWAALRGFISGTMEKKEEFVVRENAAKEPGDMEFDK